MNRSKKKTDTKGKRASPNGEEGSRLAMTSIGSSSFEKVSTVNTTKSTSSSSLYGSLKGSHSRRVKPGRATKVISTFTRRRKPVSGKVDEPLSAQLENYECPICAKMVPTSELALFKDKAYHLDCYRCSVCGNHLDRTSSPYVKKEEFFCEKCYKKMRSQSRLFQKSKTITRRGRNSFTNVSRFTSMRRTLTVASSGEKSELENFFRVSKGEKFLDFQKVADELSYLKVHYKEHATASAVSDNFLEDMRSSTLATQNEFFNCISSGLAFKNSKVGCYANGVEDYDNFKDFFHPLIRKVQLLENNVNLKVDYKNLAGRYKKPLKKKYQLSRYAGSELRAKDLVSCHFKFIRNLKKFPLPGKMTVAQRKELEDEVWLVFVEMINNKKYQGEVWSIEEDKVVEHNTCLEDKLSSAEIDGVFHWARSPPASKRRLITVTQFKQKNEKLDKFTVTQTDYKIDKYLTDTQIAANWPRHAGIYISKDKRFRIYFNHEDHLEIVLHENNPSLDLSTTYQSLVEFMKCFEKMYAKVHKKAPDYAISKSLGFVTSCPTHLGPAFVPSVTMKLKNLIDDGELGIVAKQYKSQYKTMDMQTKRSTFRDEKQRDENDNLVRIYPVRKVFESEEIVLRHLYHMIPKFFKHEADGDYI